MRIVRGDLGRYQRRRSQRRQGDVHSDPFDDQAQASAASAASGDTSAASGDTSAASGDTSAASGNAADSSPSDGSISKRLKSVKPRFSADFGVVQRLLESIKGSFGQMVVPDDYMSFSELFRVFGSRPSFMVKEDKGDEKRFLVRAGFGRSPHTFVVKKESDGSYGLYYQLNNRQEKLGDLRVDLDGNIHVSKLAQERLSFHLGRQARDIKRKVMGAGIGLTALAGLGGIGYTVLAGGRQSPPPPPPPPEDDSGGQPPPPGGGSEWRDLEWWYKVLRRMSEDSSQPSVGGLGKQPSLNKNKMEITKSGGSLSVDRSDSNPYQILSSLDPDRVEVVERGRGRVEAFTDTAQGQLEFRLDPKRSQVLLDGKVVGEFDTFTLLDALQRIREGESLKDMKRRDPLGDLIRNPWFIIAVLTALVAFSRRR